MRSDRSPDGTETILLVEDDPSFRTFVTALLERSDYRVIAVDGIDGAKREAALHSTAIRVILSDVMMPGSKGIALADALSGCGLLARILFMSGYDAAGLTATGYLAPGSYFLQKPFTRAALLAAVRELFDLEPKGLVEPEGPISVAGIE